MPTSETISNVSTPFVSEVPEPLDAGKPLVRRRYTSYLLLLCLVVILLYPVPFALVRIPAFERWAGSPYGPALDYGFNTNGMNADVVIFGDSSALYGLAPRQMSEMLGLKVVNLPNTSTSLGTYSDLVLRHYLQNNRPPRLIIFFFTPWNFDYQATPPKTRFEGEEMLLRHGTLPQIWQANGGHAAAVFEFPFQFLAIVPHTAAGAALRHDDRVAMVAESRGHMDAQGFREHLGDPCTISAQFAVRNGIATVQQLVRKYQSATTQAIAYAAPIPACSNAAEIEKYPFAAVPSAPPRVLAPHLFMDDDFYTHLAPEAATQNTDALVDAIRPLLANSPKAP